ncbi:DUF2884 family protein [Vibrio sp.]|uniref:DUF2884 family protein n=1 Tax=Vibrio sp. TaxID=678 RepID=UPI003D0E43A5
MNSRIMLSALLVAPGAIAGQCQIDIQNEIHMDDSRVEILQTSGESAVLDARDGLYLHGERVELSPDQQAALQQYRQDMQAYLPRARQFAQQGLAMANDIIDDVAASLDAPHAFDQLKISVKQMYDDIEARYYKDGDLIVPATNIDELTKSWEEDINRAMEVFSKEFFSNAFVAMSDKMKQQEGINLSELADSMAKLSDKISQRLAEYQQQMQQQRDDFCESLDEMSEQEQQLHQKIPQLKDYQVFTI